VACHRSSRRTDTDTDTDTDIEVDECMLLLLDASGRRWPHILVGSRGSALHRQYRVAMFKQTVRDPDGRRIGCRSRLRLFEILSSA
jgi:hypothetical protein